jgi:hypothetical protein
MSAMSIHRPSTRTEAFVPWAPTLRLRALVALLLAVALGGPLMAGEEPEILKLKWKRSSLGRTTGDSALAVDAAGNTHTLVNRVKKGQSILTHTWFEGRRKQTEVVTTEEAGPQMALAIDKQGGLHACYSTLIPGGRQLNYAHNDGTGWISEVVEVGGLSISMQVDDQGTPHVVHIDGSFSSEVRYAKRTPTGWESELISASGLLFGDTSLLLREGQAHVTYTGKGFEQPVMAATRDALGMWTHEVIDDNGVQSSSAFDSQGTLHVLYTFGSLKHAFRTQAGWTTEELVTSTEVFGLPLPDGVTAYSEDTAIAQGPQGRLMIVGGVSLKKGNGRANAIFVAPFDGQTIFPDLLKVSPSLGFDIELAIDSHGLAHLCVAKGQGTTLYRLKGKRLNLGVRKKGAGEIGVSVGEVACDSRCKPSYFPGLDLTLTATPADGFAFDQWRGACEGNDSTCVLTLDNNKKVLAKFLAAP